MAKLIREYTFCQTHFFHIFIMPTVILDIPTSRYLPDGLPSPAQGYHYLCLLTDGWEFADGNASVSLVEEREERRGRRAGRGKKGCHIFLVA